MIPGPFGLIGPRVLVARHGRSVGQRVLFRQFDEIDSVHHLHLKLALPLTTVSLVESGDNQWMTVR